MSTHELGCSAGVGQRCTCDSIRKGRGKLTDAQLARLALDGGKSLPAAQREQILDALHKEVLDTCSRIGEEAMTKLTDPRIFERQWLEAKGDYEDTRYFLNEHRLHNPLIDPVPDIHLARTPVGGMRNVDGQRLGDAMADIPQKFVVHSPTGFEWGYGGSGPADLALNILAIFVPPPEAWRLHQHYKFAVIAQLGRDGPHTITAESVREWIRAYWEEHPE